MPISKKQRQILAFPFTSYDALIADGATLPDDRHRPDDKGSKGRRGQPDYRSCRHEVGGVV